MINQALINQHKRNRTKEGLVKAFYKNQLRNSFNRGHKKPNYTLKELEGWVFSCSNFIQLFHNWKMSNYETNLRPSIDRIDDLESYTFKNIQLVTWAENRKKEHQRRRKPIASIHLKTKERRDFESISEAVKNTGAIGAVITRIIRGEGKSSNGYMFELIKQ